MTLITFDQKAANPTGARKHWKLFTLYQETTLVKDLRQAIDAHVAAAPGEIINASRLGAQLLRTIHLRAYPDAQSLAPEFLGMLFGMVLWNRLGTREETWHFTRTRKTGHERSAMIYVQA